MVRKLSVCLLALIAILAGAAGSARGQGRIILPPPMPPPHPPMPRPPVPVREVPLALKYLNITAEITDGVAVTTVKQTFRNQTGRPIEGMYVFPLPPDAAVGSFNMTVGGQKLVGEVLDADAARRTYEEIVRQTRDPGLLEYLGGRMYRVKIFPIPAFSQLDVELQYSQTLRESGRLVLFEHPLRGATSGDQAIEQLVLHVKLRSRVPLTSVFSPTHKCEIVRPGEREATVTFEQANYRPESDFQLYYQPTEDAVGLGVLTYRGAGEPGYFLLRVTPQVELSPDQIQPKDIAFVIDVSGSMRGGKIEQVKRALKFCIAGLRPQDRFNIYAFSSAVHPFRDALVAADEATKQAAEEYAATLEALGGTNIHGALQAALDADPRDERRAYLVLFMTDGQPTVDVTDADAILRSVKGKNARGVRFHVLGVGTDVNTMLLDKLAELNRGTREYCGENEDLELKLSGLAERLSSPVLTNLKLRIEGVKASDLYPQTLPDVFRGGDLVVLGRYEGSGRHLVEIEGRLLDEARQISATLEFPERSAENAFLPRLWAQRKIAYLLDEIRLNGAARELVDEVVRLAKRHGIVTPYTAGLILEAERPIAGGPPDMRVPRRPADRVILGFSGRAKAGGEGGGLTIAGRAPAAGAAAVRDSAQLERARRSDVASFPAAELDGEQVIRYVGAKTFVREGERWLDAAWDGQLQPRKVVTFMDEYFALLKRAPELARYFALGERVLVVLDGVAYETAPE